MDTTTRVQILNEIDCISQSTNTIKAGIWFITLVFLQLLLDKIFILL